MALRLPARCRPDFPLGVRLSRLDVLLTTLILLLHPTGHTFMGSPATILTD